MAKSKTVIVSMLWKLMERFSTQIVSFIISILLARILSPDEYGIIAIIIIFITFADVIIDGGLNTALIQKKNADQTDFSTIFWFCLFIAALLYTILFLTAPLIADFYSKEVLTDVLRVLGLVLFVDSVNSIQRAFVSRHMLFKKMFWINAVAVFFSGFLGIYMAYKGYGVWALVAQSFTNPLFCCVLMWYKVKWRPAIVFSSKRFYSLFDYGWKIFLTNFIIVLYENIRGLVIGKFYQPYALAYFERGKSFPYLLMSNVTSSINTVLLPAFADEQDDRVRVKQMMRRSVQVSYLFVLPLLVCLIITAKNLILVLLTEKWLPSVPFVQIFCIAFILMPIQNINMTAIKSLGYSGITLKLEMIKKIIETVILIVSFMIDVYAIAWGIVVYNFICIFINLSHSKKLVDYGWQEQVKDVIPTVIATLIMGLAVYVCSYIPLNSILLLLLQILVGIIVYYIIGKLMHLDGYDYIATFIQQILRKQI